mmetsp:Transcript_42213/g.91761  ORF Transcript_42213/g.91761 Transcript_42213/m.91761 type:complete len:321 (-) Transcript_42213:99-1061(-)
MCVPVPCLCPYLTSPSLNCVELSPDGSHVIGGFDDSTIKFWHLAETAEPRRTSIKGLLPSEVKVGHSGPVYNTALSPDSRYVLSCSEDATVRLWSLQTHTNLVTYKGHNYAVWDVAFSPFGVYFATAAHDRTARLWSTDHIYFLRIFAGHLSDVDCVGFHPNGTYVATGSSDNTLRLWDIQTGECVRIFTGQTSAVSCLAMAPDGKHMASGGEKGEVMLWELATSRLVAKLGQHSGPVHSLTFSNGDGATLASGGGDCTINLWDVRRGVAADAETAGVPEDLATGTFHTKHTPVFGTVFTRTNLMVAAGPYLNSSDELAL